MANVWRIHLRKGYVGDTESIGAYCIRNQVAAMGWILEHTTAKIKNFADYEIHAKAEGLNFSQVKMLAEQIKPGDFIWTHVDKTYYLARVGADSKYNYNSSVEAVRNDACNELTNIRWKAIGDYTKIDETVCKGMQRGQTLQRICNPKNNKSNFDRVLKFTEEIYEKYF